MNNFDFVARTIQNGVAMSEKNQLYFGDNLDVLRRYVGDESVDLVYLDPPFNSNANYNVLFKEHDGAEAAWSPLTKSNVENVPRAIG